MENGGVRQQPCRCMQELDVFFCDFTWENASGSEVHDTINIPQLLMTLWPCYHAIPQYCLPHLPQENSETNIV